MTSRTLYQACKPVMPYFGGKTLHADWVNAHLPVAGAYVEVFAGSAAVGLARPASPIEVFNDADAGVANLYRVIQTSPDELGLRLRFTLHSRKEHSECSEIESSSPTGTTDKIDWARRHLVLVRQSFAGGFDGSWGYGRKCGGSFHGAYQLVAPVSRRLSKATIENLHFRDLIARYAYLGEDATWYLDPPYVPETRVSKKVYRHEMTVEEHRELLSLIRLLPGMVVLSGYRSGLYDDALSEWARVELDVPCSSSNASARNGISVKPRRTECLWINPKAEQQLALSQAVIAA